MSRKLLLADDSVTIRKVVEIIFANEDFTLEAVGDGDAALEAARSDRPDLLMADVVMPGKNGYDLCRAVKHDPSLQSVPVLLLTGTFEAFDEARAVAVGADDWIAKPFESQALIDKVEELLAQAPAETAAPTVEPVVAAPAAEVPEPVAVASPIDTPEPAAAAADMWEELAEIEEPSETSAAPESAFAETSDAFDAEVAFNDVNAQADTAGETAAAEEALDAFLAEPEVDEEAFAAAEDAAQAFASAASEFSADQPEESDSWLEEAEEEDVLFLGEDDILEDDLDAAPVAETEYLTASEPLAVEDHAAVEPAGEPSAIEEESPLSATEEKPATFVAEEEPVVSTTEEEPLASFADEKPAAFAVEEEPEETVVAEAPLPSAADEQPAEESSREGLAFFQNSGLISRLAQPAAEPEEAFEPEQAPVAAVKAVREVSAASVEAQAGALSEEELTRIVEKVAATVIERLAGSVLERIAWEVVPDLAESMIKEEIRRITENA